jgi:hypothetical protein
VSAGASVPAPRTKEKEILIMNGIVAKIATEKFKVEGTVELDLDKTKVLSRDIFNGDVKVFIITESEPLDIRLDEFTIIQIDEE